MKEDYIKFTCDKCKKQTLELKRKYDEVGSPPFEKGWCRMPNFTAEVLRSYAPAIEIDTAAFEILDKHFCSEKCMIDFIKLTIKENKKDKKEKINLKECVEIFEKTHGDGNE